MKKKNIFIINLFLCLLSLSKFTPKTFADEIPPGEFPYSSNSQSNITSLELQHIIVIGIVLVVLIISLIILFKIKDK